MKIVAIIISFFCTAIFGFSQDTLYTNEGKVITGKVIEITENSIKYKSALNIDGPLYVIKKSTIVLIHYKNGLKEVFENTSKAEQQNSNTTTQTTNAQPVYVNTQPRLNLIVGGWGHPYYFNSGHHYYGYGHSSYGHREYGHRSYGHRTHR